MPSLFPVGLSALFFYLSFRAYRPPIETNLVETSESFEMATAAEILASENSFDSAPLEYNPDL